MKYLNMYKGKKYIKVRNLFCLPNSMEKTTTRKCSVLMPALEKAIAIIEFKGRSGAR